MTQFLFYLCINILILLCINPQLFLWFTLKLSYASLFLLTMVLSHHFLCINSTISYASTLLSPMHPHIIVHCIRFLDPCYNTLPMPFSSNIYLYPNCPALLLWSSTITLLSLYKAVSVLLPNIACTSFILLKS